MDAWEDQPKPRVLGAALATNAYNGKIVTIFGKVVGSVDANGKSLTLQTTDNYKVQIRFDPPLMEPLSGWLEFNGRMTSKNEMTNLNHVAFSDDFMKNFDPDLYSRTIDVYNRNVQK